MSKTAQVATRRSVIAAAAGIGMMASAGTASAGKQKGGDMLGVLKAIIQGWRNHDVEAVLAHVTDDIIWRNTSGYRPAVKGKAEMRAVLQTMAPVIKKSAWRMFDYAETGNRAFAEGVDEFWTTSGKHVAIPYAGVFTFRGNLVQEWTEYYDGRISAEMKDGAPLTDELKTMISRPEI